MDSLLYFPYISIRATPWFYKSLLYWDTIDTITPEHYLRNPDLFDGAHMTELLEAELVRPIMPMNHIYNIPDFQEDFLSYVDTRYGTERNEYRWDKTLGENEKLKGLTQIHLEKMDRIGFELVDRGLAVREDAWFCMHPEVANAFMFYLATLIAQKIGSRPITDNMAYMGGEISIADTQMQKNLINREIFRRTIINKAFPTPEKIANVSELYTFKQRNEKQLKDFRKYIERELLYIDAAPDHLKDEMLGNLIKDIEDEKRSLSEKMKEKWHVFDSATFSQMTVGALAMANAVKTGTDLAITGAGISIISTIINSIKKVQKNQQDIISTPLAYAFLTEQRWGN
ncbi:hypothetical protein [Bacillus sp. S10(2024)]|uniref:hypothetical protein n=1 Tax=Bacillus sp. S10(2024) TaxID=3162886 RepID=UPI003D25BA67